MSLRKLEFLSRRWRRSLEVAFPTLGRNRARARCRGGEADALGTISFDAMVVGILRSKSVSES